MPAAAIISINEVITKLVDNIIQPLVSLLFAVALVFFLWGMFKFLFHRDDAKEQEQGKQHMLYGVIGMFIMLSAYSILEVLGRTVGNDLSAPKSDSTLQTFPYQDTTLGKPTPVQ